jgi:hypothetical protein
LPTPADRLRTTANCPKILYRRTPNTSVYATWEFTDHRAPDRIEHAVSEPIAQLVYALALRNEDLNDLRLDPLLAALVDRKGPLGNQRRHRKDRG